MERILMKWVYMQTILLFDVKFCVNFDLSDIRLFYILYFANIFFYNKYLFSIYIYQSILIIDQIL